MKCSKSCSGRNVNNSSTTHRARYRQSTADTGSIPLGPRDFTAFGFAAMGSVASGWGVGGSRSPLTLFFRVSLNPPGYGRRQWSTLPIKATTRTDDRTQDTLFPPRPGRPFAKPGAQPRPRSVEPQRHPFSFTSWGVFLLSTPSPPHIPIGGFYTQGVGGRVAKW